VERRDPGRLEYEQAAKLVRSGADPTAAQSRAAQLVAQMRRVFDDAEITGWEGLDGTYGLPDPDDEHVVAAAIVAGAGAIVTLNTKDFPAALLPSGLETCDQRTSPPTPCPWTRLARCTRFAPSPAARVRMDRPRSFTEILDLLVHRYGFDDAVEQLRTIT
jgi:hypothetical protein